MEVNMIVLDDISDEKLSEMILIAIIPCYDGPKVTITYKNITEYVVLVGANDCG
jgi:hypothetical protein